MIRPASLVFLLVVSATLCLGAPITWDPPFDITSVNDISTSGTLVEARNATSDANSPVVNVGGENIIFQSRDFGVVFVSETENGDGTATLVWRSATPVDAASHEFIRLRAIQN